MSHINYANIKEVIAIMERAGNVAMGHWRNSPSCDTQESQLPDCGFAACFGGWVAMSPEFQAIGGYALPTGAPALGSFKESDAIAVWLGIDMDEAEGLCYTDGHYGHDVYCTDIYDVTKNDVLAALKRLLEHGSVF